MSSEFIKRSLIGTRLGHFAMSIRERMELFRSVALTPESTGTLVNDIWSTKLVAALGEDDKSFVDVGAHLGSVISLVLRKSASTKVIAIEAIPEKAAWLKTRFKDVLVHCCAVGETNGEARFFIDEKKSGYSSLIRPNDPLGHVREITVPVRTLDSLLVGERIGAIKIDVEGEELNVLRGGISLIGRERPAIMFESAPSSSPIQDQGKDLLWEWLSQHGYYTFTPTRVAHDGPPLTKDGFLDSHWYPRRTTNYFALPTEKWAFFRKKAQSMA